MADYLRREGVLPALVLCSSSRRTCETLERIRASLPDATAVLVEQRLYAASAITLLNRLRTVPDAVGSVMLIGHEPAVRELCLDLAGSGEQLDRVRRKFPTGSLAALEFDGRWRDLGHRRAELTCFVTPKELERTAS
jgi:phosphohistidine phosphatase